MSELEERLKPVLKKLKLGSQGSQWLKRAADSWQSPPFSSRHHQHTRQLILLLKDARRLAEWNRWPTSRGIRMLASGRA